MSAQGYGNSRGAMNNNTIRYNTMSPPSASSSPVQAAGLGAASFRGGVGGHGNRPRPSQPFGAGVAVQQAAATAPAVVVPAGTLPPGTIVRVGEFQVRVERFLSEGGFAHVYLATSSTPIPANSPNATTKHVLKRIAVPDTKGVQEVGKEVEVMKLLRNHPRIVNLIEASVSELPGGTNGSNGYEIYILMEWCAGGGIIDMMNTRLQNRLTESEILKVFSDTVEAVAHMHYQDPPLIHRDLKVENILLSPPQTYKLCDFGSTCKPIPRDKVPTAVEALQQLELEINKTTTLQYRAPEIVDIWSRKGFDEKIDIWALGVLLYKLCYYTTPFEEHGPLAILNAQYKIPPYPAYSNNIKGLIQGMLQESASRRPNIYQVHEQVCRLRGTSVKIENKYASAGSTALSGKTDTSSAYSDILGSGPSSTPPNAAISNLAETISPMRRGRPTKGGRAALGSESPARIIRTGGTASQGHEWQGMSSNANGTSAWPTGKSAPSTGSNGFGDDFKISSSSAATFGDSFAPGPSSLSRQVPDFGEDDSDKVVEFEGKFPSLDDFPGETFKLASDSTKTTTREVMAHSTGPVAAPATNPVSASAVTQIQQSSRVSNVSSAEKLPSIQVPQLSGERASPGPALPRRPPSQLATESASSTPALHIQTQTQPISSISTTSGPRRRASSKPELVSRASQTSPHLLVGYRLPGTGSGTSTMPSTLHQSTTTPYLFKSPVHEHELMPKGRVALPGLTRQPSQSGQSSSASPKPSAIDLLGDDPDNDDAFAPRFISNPGALKPAMSTLPPLTQAIPASSTLPPLTQNVASAVPPSAVIPQDRERFRPVKPASPVLTTGTVSGSGPDLDTASQAAEDRFPSLGALNIGSPPLSVEKKGQVDFEPIVEREQGSRIDGQDDSSDDDAGIEDFAPRRVSRKSPSPGLSSAAPNTDQRGNRGPEPLRFDSMDSIEGGGGIDLGPALSSIQRFAPSSPSSSVSRDKPLPPPKDLSRSYSYKSNTSNSSVRSPNVVSSPPPPLLAPKPQSVKQQAQISTLASSTGLDQQQQQQSQGGTATSAGKRTSILPPPASAKPSSLRRDSISSNQSQSQEPKRNRPAWGSSAPATGSAPRHSSVPLSPQRVAQPSPTMSAASTPPPPPSSSSSSARAPFKPVGPPLTPNGTRPRTSVLPQPPLEQQEEGEERFAGVSNMKSRWEQITRAQAQDSSANKGSGSGSGSGPGQPRGGTRKEWAAV